MKVNPDKFQCIVFGKVVNPDTFIINGIVVKPEERVKLLGVNIDNKLNFGHHVSHICQKADKQVKVLGRLNRVLNESNNFYCTARLYHATSTTAVLYGISAITMILLK